MRVHPGRNTRPHARLPPSYLGIDEWMISQLNVALTHKLVGHWCAWWRFWRVMHGWMYNQALADVWSTGAEIECLYCIHARCLWPCLTTNYLRMPCLYHRAVLMAELGHRHNTMWSAWQQTTWGCPDEITGLSWWPSWVIGIAQCNHAWQQTPWESPIILQVCPDGRVGP